MKTKLHFTCGRQAVIKAGRTSLIAIARVAIFLTLLVSFLPSSHGQTRPCVTIDCPPDLVVECQSAAGAKVDFDVQASSQCGSTVKVVCTPPSGSLFALGEHTVTCVAVDLQNRMARCTFKITVKDSKPPVITTPGTLEFECNAPTGRVVDFAVTAVDDCDGPITNLRCTPPSGSVFPIGTNTVICRAADKSGNSSSKYFQIIVRKDATPPELQTPRFVERGCTSARGAEVDFQVSAKDLCDPQPTVVCTPPSGSLFPIGSTTVVCVATDHSGNKSTNSFPVRVVGSCDPACLAIQCPRDIDVTLDSGPAQEVSFNVTGTNTCTGASLPVVCQPASKSLFPIGTTVVDCLVKEGDAEKRCQFRVTVRDVEPPRFLLQRGFQLQAKCSGYSLQNIAGTELKFQIKATDNSGQPVKVQCDPPSGSFFRLGTNTVHCTATDLSGNTTSTTFPVIVTPGPKCEVSAGEPQLSPDNWSFELGLTSWIAQGSAFEFQPIAEMQSESKRSRR